jgi:hypothetical protein
VRRHDANYFNLKPLRDSGADAVWTYEAPYSAVAAIAGHVAFYPYRALIEACDARTIHPHVFQMSDSSRTSFGRIVAAAGVGLQLRDFPLRRV